MANDERIYVGDIGTIIDFEFIKAGSTVREDISTATDITLLVMKPNYSNVTWAATIYGTTKLRFISIAGGFSIPGTYRVNPHLTIGSWTGTGKTVSFTVYERGG